MRHGQAIQLTTLTHLQVPAVYGTVIKTDDGLQRVGEGGGENEGPNRSGVVNLHY